MSPHTQIGCCRVFSADYKTKTVKLGTRLACISPANVLTKEKAQFIHPGDINSISSPPSLQEMENVLNRLGIQRDRTHLTDSDFYKLCILLYTNRDIFSTGPYDLGRTNLVCHRIDTGNAVPIRQRVYRQPLQLRRDIEQQTSDLLHAGIIEPSDCPWASPVVLVSSTNNPTTVHVWGFQTCE